MLTPPKFPILVTDLSSDGSLPDTPVPRVLDVQKLPVTDLFPDIEKLLQTCSTIGIVGPTGSGKSIGWGYFGAGVCRLVLPKASPKVIIAEPTRATTKHTAATVANLHQCQIGEEVGYQISRDSNVSYRTHTKFVTYGLLLRQLQQGPKKAIYVLDEAHVETVEAYFCMSILRDAVKRHKDIKLVLLTATPNERVFSFMKCTRLSTKVRLHELVELKPALTMLDSALKLIDMGQNPLIFVEGKDEMDKLCDSIRREKPMVKLFKYHADMGRIDQDACIKYKAAPGEVVVRITTDALESGITIEDVTAVLSSGYKKRSILDVNSRIEHLKILPISQSEARQQMGRAARLRKGYFILQYPGGFESLPSEGVPDIQACDLSPFILAFAQRKISITDIPLPICPDPNAVRNDLKILKHLDLVEDLKGGRVGSTQRGRVVNEIGINPRLGRMIVKARFNDKKFPGLAHDLVTIAAIVESRGLVLRSNTRWQELCGSEKESDLIAQARVLIKMKSLLRECDGEKARSDKLKEYGVIEPNFYQAIELQQGLLRQLKIETPKIFIPLTPLSVSERRERQLNNGDIFSKEKVRKYREQIMQCIAVGLSDRIYIRSDDGWISLLHPNIPREFGKTAMIGEDVSMIVGFPFDIDYRARGGSIENKHLILFPTKIDEEFLYSQGWADLIPHEYQTNGRRDRRKNTQPYVHQRPWNGRGKFRNI